MTLDKNQLVAIKHAESRHFAVIKGIAGTGKTTIIRTLCERLESAGESVLLCAFAGKAAARLREACNHESCTIHRMMGYNGVKFGDVDLSRKSIIIDEASMVSSDLLAEIVRRKPARLTLVGDPAQLPPVGRGQPFHDLISLMPETAAELVTCYRATEAVFKAANMIRSGTTPPMSAISSTEKWTIQNTGDAEKTQATLLQWIRAGAIDFAQDIVLCPRNGDTDNDASTVKALNRAIVEIVGANREDAGAFAKGDRVINCKNIAKKDVWNGSTGTVHAVDMDGGVWVLLDVQATDEYGIKKDRIKFTKKEAKDLQLAYALTVHKSQGSQYRRVVFIALQRDAWALLDRSLIYTAVTRTRKQCVVIGNVQALSDGIGKETKKRTVIQEVAG